MFTALLLLVAQASADSPQGHSAAAEKTLDAIVVTANREPVPDLASSVSVEKISADKLAKANIVRASQLSELSSALTQRSIFGASAPQFFIRGIGNNDINPNANPGIAVYLGDSFIASPIGQNLALFDIESAEILKGPQGTLFGRNATGGALVLNPRAPGEIFSGNIAAGAGEYGLRETNFALDSGRHGTVAARVAGFGRSSDGFVKNTLTGGRENDEEAHGVRVSLDLQTSGNWRAKMLLDHSKNRAGMRAHQGLGLFDPSGFANPGPAGPSFQPCAANRVLASECVNLLGFRYSADPYSGGYDRQDREHVDASGVTLFLRHEAELAFESISNYRSAKREVFEDTDASPLNIVALDFLNDSWAFTQELRISHSYNGGSWQVGAFALIEELDTVNRYDTLGQLRALGVGFIPDPNLFFFGPFRLNQSYAQRTESLAIFAQWDTELSENLTATLGTRVTDESNEFSTQTRFNEVIAQPILSPTRKGKASDTAVSWRAALRYEIADGKLLYASVNRAFKSGYFNGGALFPFDSIGPVDPEFLLAYETGIKFRLSDSLEAKAGAFFYDYNDLQDFTLRPSPPPTRQVLDSADADIRGLELSARALLPAGFSLDAGYSMLNTKFVDFIDANGVQRSGNRLTASPKQAAVAALNWEVPISQNWLLSTSVRANYRSLIYFDNTNSPLLSSPSRTIVGADLGLSNAGTGLTVRLTARNLADKAVLVDALNLAEYGFLQQTYDPPRQIGISVEQTF